MNFREGLRVEAKFIDASCESELEGVTFACVDKGSARSAIFDLLLAKRIPFIDVGMGLDRKRGSLSGMVRVTYYSAERGVEVRAKELAEMVDAPDDEYRKNIQISELNGLNSVIVFFFIGGARHPSLQADPRLLRRRLRSLSRALRGE